MSKELLQLMQRIRVKKFKESPPKKLLYEILHEIEVKKHYGRMRNWDLMVEMLAKWLVKHEDLTLAKMGVIKAFEGLSMEEDDLYKHIDSLDLFRHYVVAAKANPWDYIGEVYTELGLVGRGQNMTPRSIVELMIKMTYAGKKLNGEAEWFCYNSYRNYVLRYYQIHHAPPTHLRPMNVPLPKTQLDPCVGTGRFLFIASQMMPKAPLILFGIEINLSLYRACLVNMAMFSNHPYSIICADALRLDPDITGPASKIWDLGNRWNPPDVSMFYWKPPPIWHDRFSLKAFTELGDKHDKAETSH
ncbi:MAG: hypothetical protein DRP27_06880 [Thermotogae bacterium]|nr:MAG: hypothetical protein DRP27_06880 [Thermotogota bacterium]